MLKVARMTAIGVRRGVVGMRVRWRGMVVSMGGVRSGLRVRVPLTVVVGIV